MTTDLDTICIGTRAIGTRDTPNVPPSVDRLAFTEYGYTYPQAEDTFEVDHLIPLDLGGDDVIANLWAEPATPTPAFHQKDRVEHYLHQQVCSGAMTLMDAQRQVATDWLAVWKRIKDQDAPMRRPRTTTNRAQAHSMHPLLRCDIEGSSRRRSSARSRLRRRPSACW